MTRHEILQRYPNASESFIQRNLAPVDRPAPAAEPKQASVQAVDRGEKGQVGSPAKCSVRIESRRVRIQDPDNAVAKFHVDALRYAGLIPDDTTAEIELAITQTKVATKAEECSVITLTKIPDVTPEYAAQIFSKHYDELKL